LIRATATVVLAFAALSGGAQAEEKLTLCYEYGCAVEAEIRYSDAQLASIQRLLAGAENAARERSRLALAVGMLYAWAGRQSPIRNDRGGDYADDGVVGRMDCIDHAQSTTRLLRMIEARGWIRFHKVLDPVRRTLYLVTQHFSAAVEELPAPVGNPVPAAMGQQAPNAQAGRFVIDSWFHDNGWPAVVLPLEDWRNGAGPDV
jgi:hypothetical protein